MPFVASITSTLTANQACLLQDTVDRTMKEGRHHRVQDPDVSLRGLLQTSSSLPHDSSLGGRIRAAFPVLFVPTAILIRFSLQDGRDTNSRVQL